MSKKASPVSVLSLYKKMPRSACEFLRKTKENSACACECVARNQASLVEGIKSIILLSCLPVAPQQRLWTETEHEIP